MKRIALSVNMCASLAQLDRVFGYEPKGRGFESLTTRQQKSNPFGLLFCCCFVTLEPPQARKGLNGFAPAETCEVCTNRRANRGSESLTTRQQKSNPFGLLFCCCFVTLEPPQARKGLNGFAPAETCEVCTNRRANRGSESLTTRQQKSNPFGLLFCCCFVTLEPPQARKGLNGFAPAETCEVCTNRRANRGSESLTTQCCLVALSPPIPPTVPNVPINKTTLPLPRFCATAGGCCYNFTRMPVSYFVFMSSATLGCFRIFASALPGAVIPSISQSAGRDFAYFSRQSRKSLRLTSSANALFSV